MKIGEQLRDKIIVGLLFSMLSTGVTFLYSSGEDLWYLPKTVKHLKALHTRDSVMAVRYIWKIDSLSKEVEQWKRWQEDDHKSIQRINRKLKITSR